jgi:hypothetical protein
LTLAFAGVIFVSVRFSIILNKATAKALAKKRQKCYSSGTHLCLAETHFLGGKAMKKIAVIFAVILWAATLYSRSALSQQPAPTPSPTPIEYITNDPKLNTTWARTINLLKAWAKILDIEHNGQPKMQQAVMVFMEEWVDCSHPEFQDMCLPQYVWNATDRPYVNSQMHGNQAAGIGGAKGDNKMGIAGVGGLMDRIKFIPIKVCDDQLCKPEWVLAGLRKVLEYKRAGVPIVVVGCNFLTGVDDPVATDQVLKDLAAEGIDIVAPASNANPSQNMDESNAFPVTSSRTYDNIIPVAALDETAEQLASFSGYGAGTIRLLASGVNIPTISFLDPNGSSSMSGNSAVTEQITGAIAVSRVYGSSDSKEARHRLYFTARMFPALEGKVKASPGSSDDAGRMAGRIDLYDALTTQIGCPAQSPDIMVVGKRDTNRATAITSPWLVSGPFALQDPMNADGMTRILLFAYNVGTNLSNIVVQAKNTGNELVRLPVEAAASLPAPLACVTQLNVVLTTQPKLSSGDRPFTITVGTKTSSEFLISIK